MSELDCMYNKIILFKQNILTKCFLFYIESGSLPIQYRSCGTIIEVLILLMWKCSIFTTSGNDGKRQTCNKRFQVRRSIR